MEKALIPIEISKITEGTFNETDVYYKTDSVEYSWCICWNEFKIKSKTYMCWSIAVPMDRIQILQHEK